MKLFNFKSLFASLLCGALVLSASGLSNTAHAAKSVQEVQLKLTSVEIQLKPNLEMVRTETGDTATVKLIDRKTGETTETYSETIESVKSVQGKGINAASGNYTTVTVKNNKKDGPVTTELAAKLKIYTNSSFRQINSIESKTMKITNSNSATLEDKDIVAISTSDKFPTQEVEISGSATITYKSTSAASATGAFSVSALTAAGFEVSITGSQEWEFYARKPVDIGLRYKV
ncbi:hypothetical protein BBR47_35120 [Brevibacillus brevis NBRC 100599]|uniref:Uncharacterized protein n=1 Tax=Brevibacillus brevis (strain 47 / JCM 6285 / NBRC 100599) TaxID=358681 RepID=C0ZFD0_BREBN|nr:hypothetical protein [Brevibacillus brevis]BAH44489.1 hypothetical protein BBR47_35120 [Brevibacillus brevis NBRC 100599]